MKFRKCGTGWDISQRLPIRLQDIEVTPPPPRITKRVPIRIEDVEVTSPPPTPSPLRRSKRIRKKKFID